MSAALPADGQVGRADDGDAPIVVGPVIVHPGDFCAEVDGRPVWFTRREFDLLLVLVRRVGRPVARDTLRREVWGALTADPRDRSVECFVRRVRLKLERASDSYEYIHTHVSIGYRFAPQSRGLMA